MEIQHQLKQKSIQNQEEWYSKEVRFIFKYTLMKTDLQILRLKQAEKPLKWYLSLTHYNHYNLKVFWCFQEV